MTPNRSTLLAPLLPLILAAGLAPHAEKLRGARRDASTVQTPLATQPSSHTLTVLVTGADRAGGQLGAAVFSAADGFPDKQQNAVQTSVRPRTAPVDSFVFKGLAAGRYAVSVYHDQNSNTKLDANLFGVPKEPWGTTANVRPRMRAPRFEEAAINVTADTRIEIRVER